MSRVVVKPGYEVLASILDEALEQAQSGKGLERHACGEPFEQQTICEVARRVGMGYPLGQATKKTYESERLEPEAAVRELLGAINYLVAGIIIRREGIEVKQQEEGQPPCDALLNRNQPRINPEPKTDTMYVPEI